jgi:hypothetical protein
MPLKNPITNIWYSLKHFFQMPEPPSPPQFIGYNPVRDPGRGWEVLAPIGAPEWNEYRLYQEVVQFPSVEVAYARFLTWKYPNAWFYVASCAEGPLTRFQYDPGQSDAENLARLAVLLSSR